MAMTGAERSRKYYAANKEKILARQRQYLKDNPDVALLKNQKSAFRRYQTDGRGYNFKLTRDQFRSLVEMPCHYCGFQPERPFTNGIDRVDNLEGYLVDNCVPCCKHCNIAKRDRSVEEFLAWADRLYTYQNR